MPFSVNCINQRLQVTQISEHPYLSNYRVLGFHLRDWIPILSEAPLIYAWRSLAPTPFSITTSCICSSAAVTVSDHLQAGILRSYSSSISAAERLHHVSSMSSCRYLVRAVIPSGLGEVEPHEDTNRHGEGAIHEACLDTKCEKHGRGGIAAAKSQLGWL